MDFSFALAVKAKAKGVSSLLQFFFASVGVVLAIKTGKDSPIFVLLKYCVRAKCLLLYKRKPDASYDDNRSCYCKNCF